MTRRKDLIRRYRELVDKAHAIMDELTWVLSERSRARDKGEIESDDLILRTQRITRQAIESQRDAFRLRADLIEEKLKSGTAGLDSLSGLDIPSFMPEEL
jgi:hypothetical protein